MAGDAVPDRAAAAVPGGGAHLGHDPCRTGPGLVGRNPVGSKVVRILRVTSIVALLLTPLLAPAATAAQPLAPAYVHTAGRTEAVDGNLLYSWPGVYFEGRFRGT